MRTLTRHIPAAHVRIGVMAAALALSTGGGLATAQAASPSPSHTAPHGVVTLKGELSSRQSFTAINSSTISWTLRVGHTRYPVDLTHTVVVGPGPAFIASQSYPAQGSSTVGGELDGAVVSISGTLDPHSHLLSAERTDIVQSPAAVAAASASHEDFPSEVGHFLQT
ncbi:MAG: hypothetical protein ACYDA6_02470, partial [Solirubrobacteraceae bacterium]